MRILALSHIFPPAIDGGSQIIYQAAKQLKNRGHALHYLSSNHQSSDDFIKNPLAKIFRKFGLPPGPFLNPIPLFKAILFKPQIILAGPLPTTIIFYARFLQILTNAKVIFVPCFHQNNPQFPKKYFFSLLKNFHLWVFTSYEKKLLEPYTKNIYNHFPGIDSKFFLSIRNQKNTKLKKLLFLGNFAAHKGILPLIRSMQYLPPNYRLTLCGQPSLYTNSHSNFSSTKQIQIFAKRYSTKKAISLLDQHDFLVMPSSEESFGLVFAEALARNKPIFGLNQASTKEVFQTLKTGVLFSNSNPKVIAQTILKHQKVFVSQQTHKLVEKLCSWENVGIWLEKYLL